MDRCALYYTSFVIIIVTTISCPVLTCPFKLSCEASKIAVKEKSELEFRVRVRVRVKLIFI